MPTSYFFLGSFESNLGEAALKLPQKKVVLRHKKYDLLTINGLTLVPSGTIMTTVPLSLLQIRGHATCVIEQLNQEQFYCLWSD